MKQNGGDLELFLRFRLGTENRGFNQVEFFFAVIFQITSRFVSTKEKLGVRCTVKTFWIEPFCFVNFIATQEIKTGKANFC